MPAPDLNDPVAAAAYQHELHGVAAGIRRTGLALALTGALLVLAAKRALWGVPMWLGVSVLGFGMMLLITAFAARNRYHALRMAEED